MKWLDDICMKAGWSLGILVYRIKAGKDKAARVQAMKKNETVRSRSNSENTHDPCSNKLSATNLDPIEQAEKFRKMEQEFREKLRIGTILETDDFAYIRVEEITPEGAISRTLFENRHLYTWEDLKSYECTIYSQPANSINISHIVEYVPPDVSHEDILYEIACELCRLCPNTWQAIRLDVEVINPNIRHPQFVLSILNPETGDRRIQPTGFLNNTVTLLFQVITYRQRRGWNYLSMLVKEPHSDKMNYGTDFSYHSEKDGYQPICSPSKKMFDSQKRLADQQAGVTMLRAELKEQGKIVDIEDLKK